MINNILKNNQLNIYEKMCMLVLTEYSLKVEAIDTKILAKLMGCDEIYVKHALESLELKGFILKHSEIEEEPTPQILHGEEAEVAEDYAFKKFESTKYSGDSLIDQCIDLIEEPLSYKQAKIMLSIAKNNLEEIERSYQLAKASQVTDTIGFLINDLQKPKGSNRIESERKIVERRDVKSKEQKPNPYAQSLEKRSTSQVDTSKILKLKKYQQYQDL